MILSKYTTQLRYIIESIAGMEKSIDYGTAVFSAMLESARTKIFDFSYPIFDENYKSVLETKILKHYFTMEIGFEVYGLFHLKLDTKLNEIMPYYNKLYNSAQLEFNPFDEINLEKQYVKNGTSNNELNESTNVTDNGSEASTSLYSDTPQGGIDGIESGHYLTNATKNNSTNSNNTSGTTESVNTLTNTDEYVETIKGKNSSASYSKLLNEYRETLINIDMMIINELSDLFMNLW